MPTMKRGYSHLHTPDPRDRREKIVREVVDAIRMMGFFLVLGGGVTTISMADRSTILSPKLALITGLVTVPGVLYLVAAWALARRRYWGWVMGFSVTTLLILALIAITIALLCSNSPGRFIAMIPMALYISMPSLILIYMLRGLAVVREAQSLEQKGFIIVPRVQTALPDARNDTAL
jgi:hypothetical protein